MTPELAIVPWTGIALVITAFSAAVLPFLMKWQDNRAQARHDREKEERERRLRAEDYARQDARDAKIEEAARLLVERQDQVAAQTKQTADLLAANNEKVAATAKIHEAKLDQIHTLVNSNLTAALEAELAAHRSGLMALKELAEYRIAHNEPVSETTARRIEETEAAITGKSSELADRLRQTATAAAQLKVDMGGAK